jgi:hypothetical protein
MKNLMIATAAIMALSAGSAFAATVAVNGEQANVPNRSGLLTGTTDGNGIYVSHDGQHEVWVYGAMRGPGYTQGGRQ